MLSDAAHRDEPDDDDDEDFDEEESLVLVELSGIIDNGFLQTCGSKCKLLNVETERPVLQLGHYVFKGKYENVGCSAVIFQVETEATASNQPGLASDGAPPSKVLKFYDITRKKLNMTRAFLSEKSPTQSESTANV